MKSKIFFGNIYSLKSKSYFQGTLMYFQYGFLYLILTRKKFTVSSPFHRYRYFVASYSHYYCHCTTCSLPSMNPPFLPPPPSLYQDVWPVYIENLLRFYPRYESFSFRLPPLLLFLAVTQHLPFTVGVGGGGGGGPTGVKKKIYSM